MLFAATCGSAGGRAAGALVIALLAAGYVALLVACMRRASGVRGRLVLLFLAAVSLGAFVALFPNGMDDVDADYLARFMAGTSLAAAVGAGVALTTDVRHAWRFVVAGALGGATFLAGAVGWLLVALSLTGACLD
jgi:hypothetical protein